MARNENAQGHRYQEHVNKYAVAHEAAGGDGWAEKYREEGRVAKAAADLVKEQEHAAAGAGALSDEEPVAAAVDFVHVVVPGEKPQEPGVLTSTGGPIVTMSVAGATGAASPVEGSTGA